MKNIGQELKKHFAQEDLESRILRVIYKDNKIYALISFYVNARAVMDRLDEVVGIGNWKDEIVTTDRGVICKLSLKIDNEWITKEDGAEYTQVEAFKGGISDSLKRTAVKFGIGRYLYNIKGVFAEVITSKPAEVNKWNYVKKKEDPKTKELIHPAFWWREPKLPKQFLPQEEKAVVEIKKITPEQKASISKLFQFLANNNVIYSDLEMDTTKYTYEQANEVIVRLEKMLKEIKHKDTFRKDINKKIQEAIKG